MKSIAKIGLGKAETSILFAPESKISGGQNSTISTANARTTLFFACPVDFSQAQEGSRSCPKSRSILRTSLLGSTSNYLATGGTAGCFAFANFTVALGCLFSATTVVAI